MTGRPEQDEPRRVIVDRCQSLPVWSDCGRDDADVTDSRGLSSVPVQQHDMTAAIDIG